MADSQETEASPSFSLNFDQGMDSVWGDCLSLLQTTRGFYDYPSELQLVKPFHLALQLLFGNLVSVDDSRLHTMKVELPNALELPLFWTAISQAIVIPDKLDDHLRSDSRKQLHLQQKIGQALWRTLEDERGSFGLAEAKRIISTATQDTTEVLKRAEEIRVQAESPFMAQQHVLLALLENKQLLGVLKRWPLLKSDKLPDIIRELRPMFVSKFAIERFPKLKQWAIDVTEKIQKKKKEKQHIDPLIGRSSELRRLIAILSRYKKNSAVLLGEPGVGKTAIVTGLAELIVDSKVPESVIARVFELDLTSILASTQCKLAYEQIVKEMLEEVAEHDKSGIKAIIFFDNLSHITVGGYQDDGTGLDAATIMKPYLMRGMLRCIGCSTLEDFRIHIEKDGALTRQFSIIDICENTTQQATEVLRGLKDAFQQFHRVRITDEALKAASSIATQFFAHKRLPDAALDLIDEACASASLDRMHDSEVLRKLQRERIVREMEIRALDREVDEESDRKLMQARVNLRRLDEKIEYLTSAKRYCKRLGQKLKTVTEKIRENRTKLSNAKDRASKLKILDMNKELLVEQENLRNQLKEAESGAPIMSPVENETESSGEQDPITVEKVAKTASYYTFVPAAEILESKDMIHIAERLREIVVCQDEAIRDLSGAVQALWAGLKNPQRPIASFLFGGPSGSGKTLLVKELANIVLRQSGRLILINASDYREPHNLTRLLGTPACTGFDHGGQLTECIRRKPFSVVYIKDIELACTEFRVLIQTILDEGTIKDGDGKTVDFNNCLIILSTSVGQTSVPNDAGNAKEREHFRAEIHKHFPEEFLARFDHITIFRRVTSEVLLTMVGARIEELRKQLELVNLRLNVPEIVEDYLLYEASKNRIGSARRLERLFRVEILQPLAKLLIKNGMPVNKVVTLTSEYDEEDEETVGIHLEEEISPALSSPSTTFQSLPSDDESDAGSITTVETASVDEEHSSGMPSWPTLRAGGPPVLLPQPQKIY